jgi:pyruvate/2-oxoglutarate dehydrogenase complex dihydrolipoamide acyltransferase (E2) component
LNVRQLVLVAVAALAVGGTAVAQAGQSAPTGQAATPPPPPPPNGNVATPGTLIGTPAPAPTPAGAGPTITPAPAASQAPAGRRGRRGGTPEPAPSASDTPEPPQFATMDGVWEVQVQPLTGTGRAIYSHLAIAQKGDQLSGTWMRENNQKVPFTGTFDGRLFKLTSTDGKTAWTFSGYAENFSDMVGLLQTADPKDKGTPFTATHRKKDRL